jgi:hypothetical protein
METAIIVLVVALAAGAGVWTFVRSLKGKDGCDCSQSCQTCEDSKLDIK